MGHRGSSRAPPHLPLVSALFLPEVRYLGLLTKKHLVSLGIDRLIFAGMVLCDVGLPSSYRVACRYFGFVFKMLELVANVCIQMRSYLRLFGVYALRVERSALY
jgi:hypothetical protein